MKIKLKDEILKQLKEDKSIKTLGMHMRPSLNQNDEHEKVKKIDDINKKIMSKQIKSINFT